MTTAGRGGKLLKAHYKSEVAVTSGISIFFLLIQLSQEHFQNLKSGLNTPKFSYKQAQNLKLYKLHVLCGEQQLQYLRNSCLMKIISLSEVKPQLMFSKQRHLQLSVQQHRQGKLRCR